MFTTSEPLAFDRPVLSTRISVLGEVEQAERWLDSYWYRHTSLIPPVIAVPSWSENVEIGSALLLLFASLIAVLCESHQ
jgi:hypothetical protein